MILPAGEYSLIDWYRDWLDSRGYSPESIRSWVGMARRLISTCGDRPLPDTPEAAADVISTGAAARSPRSCGNNRAGMRHFYEYLGGHTYSVNFWCSECGFSEHHKYNPFPNPDCRCPKCGARLDYEVL